MDRNFPSRRRLLGLIGLLAVGHALAARDAEPVTGSTQADGVFPRTVQHWQGATVITRAPLRVAALSTGQADALLTLGLMPAGATRDERGSLWPDYLRRSLGARAAALAGTADLGTRTAPDLEALARLRPDLILVHRTVLKPGLLALFQRIAPTVVTQGTGTHWQSDFRLLADAVGRREQAQAWLGDFAAVTARARRAWQGAPPEVSFVQSGGGRLRIMGQSSFVGGIARDMGLRRPPAQAFKRTSQDVGAERLDLADGDWIFYGARGEAVRSLTGSPLWGLLGGVRQQRAVRVDYDPFFMNAGPTAARQVLQALETALGPAARAVPP